ncbi:MAG: SCO family protein [Thermodesulfobacteriota bacterium]
MPATMMRLVGGFLLLSILVPPLSVHGAQEARYKRSEERYSIPDVTLITQDRRRVNLRDFILSSDKPVLLDFIYGTCTTICPVLSAGFVNMQRRINGGAQAVRLVSISIDPEHDTPEVMAEYLGRYGAKPGWDFFTGSREDIDKVMRAFDAYVINKMSHYPITFLRKPGDEGWVRIHGLISTAELMKEYQALMGQ